MGIHHVRLTLVGVSDAGHVTLRMIPVLELGMPKALLPMVGTRRNLCFLGVY